MTLTFRTSRRIYQRHPRGAPDGVISAPLARLTGSDGATVLTTEVTRQRLFAASNPFTPAADFVNRLVTLRNTPPSSSSAGTRRMENWTFRITDVDAAGNWIEMEGFRADVAGTSISYTIHPSATFVAASANFPLNESTLERTNSGPVEWQSIYFLQPTNQSLRLVPFIVSGRNSATSLRISDPYDLLSSIPTESSLQWELRDRPIATLEEIFRTVFGFIVQCGWSVYQFRGRNNGAGLGKRIIDDVIFFSAGEDGKKRMYLRMVAGNRNASGAYSSGELGIDFAFYSAWDRTFANPSDVNPGNGVNACHNSFSTSNLNTWAAQADAANSTTLNEPVWSPKSANGNVFQNTMTFGSEIPNVLNTPSGGEIQELNYCFFGNKDALELLVSCYGFGHQHISLGSLVPRPDGNDNVFFTNSRIANGSSITVRIGGPQKGESGYPGNGENPQAPTSGVPYQIGDAFQVVGQRVNAGITPAVAHSGEYIESSTITAFPGILAARGSITTVAATLISDGQTFTLDDGTGTGGPNGNGIYVFEFDKNASVSGTNVAVTISDGQTADQVRDACVSAINGTVIGITATNGGTATVALVNDVIGGVGNITIEETVSNANFVVDGMDGGGFSLQLASLAYSYTRGAMCGEDPQPNYIAVPFHKGTSSVSPLSVSGVVRVSNRARAANVVYKDHNGPAMVDGNGFDCVLTPGGISDLLEVNPSDRTGRFGITSLFVRDSTGGQLRGSLPFLRVGNPRMGDFKLIRDRDDKYYMLIPIQMSLSLAVQYESIRFVAVIGPMPREMAINA